MHRFFCTVCKKAKRVHANPFTDRSGIEVLELRGNNVPVHNRIGVCRVHVLRHGKTSRAQVDSRVKVHSTIAKVKTAPAQKAQKGRK
jgi:transposase